MPSTDPAARGVGCSPGPRAAAADCARAERRCAPAPGTWWCSARPTTPTPGADARMRRAEALIAADPGAPHTVRSLAQSVSLSPSRFAHLFTQQFGQSPMRALREARLRHAARLLEGSDLSVER